MKFSDFSKSMTPLEMAALVVFIIYLVFPFQTPSFIVGTVNTPIGLIVIFIVTLYLFFYTNPVLGIIYIFVAYELLRRSSLIANSPTIIKNTPSESKRTSEMQQMNPPNPIVNRTLEEDVIRTMNPARDQFLAGSTASSYQPVAERIVGASKYQ